MTNTIGRVMVKLCGSTKTNEANTFGRVAFFVHLVSLWFWPTGAHPKLNIYKRCATEYIHTIIFRFLCIFLGDNVPGPCVNKNQSSSTLQQIQIKFVFFSISFPRCFCVFCWNWIHICVYFAHRSANELPINFICISVDFNGIWPYQHSTVAGVVHCVSTQLLSGDKCANQK